MSITLEEGVGTGGRQGAGLGLALGTLADPADARPMALQPTCGFPYSCTLTVRRAAGDQAAVSPTEVTLLFMHFLLAFIPPLSHFPSFPGPLSFLRPPPQRNFLCKSLSQGLFWGQLRQS